MGHYSLIKINNRKKRYNQLSYRNYHKYVYNMYALLYPHLSFLLHFIFFYYILVKYAHNKHNTITNTPFGL